MNNTLSHIPHPELTDTTLADLQAGLTTGQWTATTLTKMYLARIEAIDRDPRIGLNSVIELNPDALEIAALLDEERRAQKRRGPLHGIPVLLKDNIDTADRMQTSAGSLALVGQPAVQDATVAARLRAAGAVLLGKTNLSEWANFRSTRSTSGWSGRGGQTRNPHALDRNPSGSSSGSAAAVAANLCAVALGTETDGSVISPSGHCGVVGIKPTVGLTSRAGVVPIAHSQDTVGVHARCVVDAATMLHAIAGEDVRDSATHGCVVPSDYAQFLDVNGLQGARIGVLRGDNFTGYSDATDAVFEAALTALRNAGAVLVDPMRIPNANKLGNDPAEFIVMVHEFKRDLNAYLSGRTGVAVRSLADVIAFNRAHAEQALPFFDQELLILTESDPFSEDIYQQALARGRELAGKQGIDAALREHRLEALVAPTNAPAGLTDLVCEESHRGDSTSLAAVAGYPIVSVPAGMWFGLPVGLSFIGTAFSEPTLIRLAYAFEQATLARRPPQFLPTVNLKAGPGTPRLEQTAADILAQIMHGTK